jgi:hypothetical protein
MSTLTHVRADLGARRKVRSFERFLNRHTDSLTRRFGPSEAAIMRREMLEEYRALIPQVPDIGGRRNPWNANLAGAPMALAGYRVVLRHGGSAQDAGEMVRAYAQRQVERIPRRLRPLLRPRPSRAQKVARWTQQRRYPDDWVAEFVDGTGQPFDFGLDVTECAIVKFMHAQGADEFTPWLCHLDYVMAEAAGYGLTRTRTLAWGCDRCDFRMTANGTTTATWPPDFPERTCGQSGTPGSSGSTS